MTKSAIQMQVVDTQESSDEKDCVCGQVVPLDTRFCSGCGHQFPEEAAPVPADMQS
ncbi:hypothetical protein LQV63_27040 [Paenibacillus profundus]|uniref:Uncharacterized protein n=1 Tax=Paenibacillus profundus TaxID=1173085 RepID=A0ABS8YM66_9BACL|nr:hypothetical protein [Paenibacillus profundus]